MVIRLNGITKRFPGAVPGDDVLANDAVSLAIESGEVHCLLGENGAGKSTLIAVLSGLQQPDAGEIEIDGARVVLSSPAAAIGFGIGVVQQHSTLIPAFTVLENLMLGDRGRANSVRTRPGLPRIRMDRRAARRRLAELEASVGTGIDPDRRVADLGLGERQRVEIVKAMWSGARVLVLDEPTSMLVPQAVDALLRSIERVRAAGVAVVLVTHKLREAVAVGDRVTVLRGGRVVGRIAPHELRAMSAGRAEEAILDAMFGADRLEVPGTPDPSPSSPSPSSPPSPPLSAPPLVLSVESLSTTADAGETPVSAIGFDLASGEVLGVAGMDGEGQRHLAEAIAGQRRPAAGRILLRRDAGPQAEAPIDITRLGVRARRSLGVRYVTDDRLHEGIVGSMSVALNLLLGRIGEAPFWRRGRMDRRAVDAEADRRIAAYDIRTPSRSARAGSLSGGNIQKILLARELAEDPRVVVFHKPTAGLDLRTVEHVRAEVRAFASAGGAALLISTDLDELVRLSDRIIVLSGGSAVGEVVNDGRRVAERVGALMAGAAG